MRAIDRVAFSFEFLRQLGASPLSPWARARGTVIEGPDEAYLTPLVRVLWDDGEESLVPAVHLRKLGSDR